MVKSGKVVILEVTMENLNKIRSAEESLKAIEKAREELFKNLAANHPERISQPESVNARLKNISSHSPAEEVRSKKNMDNISLLDLTKAEASLTVEIKEKGVDLNLNMQKDNDKILSKEKAKELVKESEGRKPEKGISNKKEDTKEDKKDEDEDKDEKQKDKEKDSPQRQEEKAREMVSKVKLPSGMEIHQEGPSWVLVSKDGKERTDVTDIMNRIEKYNRDVDNTNEANKKANEDGRIEKNVQNNADEAAAKGQNEGIGQENSTIPSINDQKVATVEAALPSVTNEDGTPTFKEEDIKAVAEFSIKEAEEQLGKGMDQELGRKLSREARDRDKNNQEKADEKAVRDAMILKQMQEKKQR